MANDIVKKPQCVAEAASAKKGLNWALEILVFVAVFLVSAILMVIPTTIGVIALLVGNSEFMQATVNQDTATLMKISMEAAYSAPMMILALFTDALMILTVFLFCKWFQKRKLRTLGFIKKGMVKEYLVGALLGLVFFSVAILGSVVTGGVVITGFDPTFSIGMFIVLVFGFMIQGMAEEVLSRGYFMVSFARRWPMWSAVLINAVLFAVLHLMNSGISVLPFINLTLFGIFASLYFIYRGSIWGIGAFHTTWNLVQGNLYGIKVSGNNMGTSILSSVSVEGMDLLNGGPFGLEGSIMVTIVLTAGIVFLFFKTRVKKQQASVSA